MFECFILKLKKNNCIIFPTHKNKKWYKKGEEVYNNGNNIDCGENNKRHISFKWKYNFIHI